MLVLKNVMKEINTYPKVNTMHIECLINSTKKRLSGKKTNK